MNKSPNKELGLFLDAPTIGYTINHFLPWRKIVPAAQSVEHPISFEKVTGSSSARCLKPRQVLLFHGNSSFSKGLLMQRIELTNGNTIEFETMSIDNAILTCALRGRFSLESLADSTMHMCIANNIQATQSEILSRIGSFIHINGALHEIDGRIYVNQAIRKH